MLPLCIAPGDSKVPHSLAQLRLNLLLTGEALESDETAVWEQSVASMLLLK